MQLAQPRTDLLPKDRLSRPIFVRSPARLVRVRSLLFPLTICHLLHLVVGVGVGRRTDGRTDANPQGSWKEIFLNRISFSELNGNTEGAFFRVYQNSLGSYFPTLAFVRAFAAYVLCIPAALLFFPSSRS